MERIEKYCFRKNQRYGMKNTYLISEWALIRRNELVDIPDCFEIHLDFLHNLSQDEFESAFRQIHEMFYQMYTDMSESPEAFGFPLYCLSEYDYFSKEARKVRTAPWNPFYLLLCLFTCGEFEGSAFVSDTVAVRKINKAKKTNLLLKALTDYGFVFEGIKNFSLSSTKEIIIDYPDNRNILEVLSLVAKKVWDTQLKDVNNFYSNMVAFSNGFVSWNYKVLKDDLQICTLAQGCDYVSDKMHSQEEKEVICIIDKLLMEQGFTMRMGDPNEGPAIRYYRTQSVYDFALVSHKGSLLLELRIRNAEACLDYLSECPDRIVDMFRYTDKGCHNRVNNTCKYGVKYVLENEEKWHCGCCGAPFRIHPVEEDIEHYFRLVELGNKRNR